MIHQNQNQIEERKDNDADEESLDSEVDGQHQIYEEVKEDQQALSDKNESELMIIEE